MNVVCLRMTFFMFRPIFYLMITYCMKGIYFVVSVISIRWYQKKCNLTQVYPRSQATENQLDHYLALSWTK